jgi:uncharacterized surface protein with fasciclin (FAS1) repeats
VDSGLPTSEEIPDLGYHVISGELLLEMLRRVEAGESADLVYAEAWANADHEQPSEE